VIEDSLINNNGGGVNISGAGGAVNNGILRNSIVDRNVNFSTQIAAPSSLVMIGNLLSGTTSSIINLGGAVVTSYGNNVIRGTGAPTQILPLQ
jgi:hypothetical protein